jgi:hypothetical protein
VLGNMPSHGLRKDFLKHFDMVTIDTHDLAILGGVLDCPALSVIAKGVWPVHRKAGLS